MVNRVDSDRFLYIKFYKPYGVLTQFRDSSGRPTLADFIKVPNVYPAGRLDRDSEGLLILTNDGGVAHRLTTPEFEHSKTYLVQVERIPDDNALAELSNGVVLSDGPTLPAAAKLLESDPSLPERPEPIRFRKNVPTAWIELVIREGRNRQVRRMTAAVGHPTLRLVRTAIAGVTLGDLQPGQSSPLSALELSGLLRRELRSSPPRRPPASVSGKSRVK